MKKRILLILIFMGMFFVGGRRVFATVSCEDEDCIRNYMLEEFEYNYRRPLTNVICMYVVTQNDGKKYYTYILRNKYDIFFGGTTKENFRDDCGWLDYDCNKKYSFHLTNEKDGDDAFIFGDAYKNLMQGNKCPSSSYIDITGDYDEVCFDDGDGSCENNGKEINKGTIFNSTIESKLILDDTELINPVFVKNYGEVCTEENQKLHNYTTCKYWMFGEEIEVEVVLYYNGSKSFVYLYNGDQWEGVIGHHKAHTEVFDDNSRYNLISNTSKNLFKLTSPDNTFGYDISVTLENHIPYNINSCPEQLYFYRTFPSNKEYRYGLYVERQDFTDLKLADLMVVSSDGQCDEQHEEEPIVEEIDCNLIDSDIRKIINYVMDAIKIGVPILLIGLIIYDFATAFFAGADDKISKAKGRAIKRVIIAIIIFFVPTLINLVFDLTNEVWRSTNLEICGIDEN